MPSKKEGSDVRHFSGWVGKSTWPIGRQILHTKILTHIRWKDDWRRPLGASVGSVNLWCGVGIVFTHPGAYPVPGIPGSWDLPSTLVHRPPGKRAILGNRKGTGTGELGPDLEGLGPWEGRGGKELTHIQFPGSGYG